MNYKRSFISGIYKEKSKKLRTLGINNEHNKDLDLKTVLTHLKSLFPEEKFQSCLPPIIMQHQIYAFLPDRTEVDKQLNEMRRKGQIRLFKLGSSQEEVAVVFTSDYVKHVEKCCGKNLTVAYFINHVVKICPDMCFYKDALLGQHAMREESIRELIQQGLLIAKDVGCYWLSIPQVGEFVKTFLYGRRAVLQFIRRTKYKEILQSEIEQRKLPKKAVLGIKYHIYDLIGSDLVKCIDVGCENMLRLQAPGS